MISSKLLTKYLLSSIWTKLLMFLIFYFIVLNLHYFDSVFCMNLQINEEPVRRLIKDLRSAQIDSLASRIDPDPVRLIWHPQAKAEQLEQYLEAYRKLQEEFKREYVRLATEKKLILEERNILQSSNTRFLDVVTIQSQTLNSQTQIIKNLSLPQNELKLNLHSNFTNCTFSLENKFNEINSRLEILDSKYSRVNAKVQLLKNEFNNK